MSKFITLYLCANHQRLELLFIAFKKHKTNDPGYADTLLESFITGMQQHILWEEELVFPILKAINNGVLSQALKRAKQEHKAILERLLWIDSLHKKSMLKRDDEIELEYMLSDHFENDEFDLYPLCDRYFNVNQITQLILQLDNKSHIHQCEAS